MNHKVLPTAFDSVSSPVNKNRQKYTSSSLSLIFPLLYSETSSLPIPLLGKRCSLSHIFEMWLRM